LQQHKSGNPGHGWKSRFVILCSVTLISLHFCTQLSSRYVIALVPNLIRQKRGCQIFLATIYQNGENLRNDRNIFWMAYNITSPSIPGSPKYTHIGIFG
jgi:hypothetical protein